MLINIAQVSPELSSFRQIYAFKKWKMDTPPTSDDVLLLSLVEMISGRRCENGAYAVTHDWIFNPLIGRTEKFISVSNLPGPVGTGYLFFKR